MGGGWVGEKGRWDSMRVVDELDGTGRGDRVDKSV